MSPWLDTTIIVLVQIIMLVGLIGLVVPIFPGTVVIWGGALLYAIVTGFDTLSIVMFILITLLMIAGSLVDNVFMGAGARKGGASWLTIGVALFGAVVGTIAFPPFGGLIAAPLAVLILEFWRTKEIKKAGGALLGMATGWGLSFLARFGIGFLMMVFWWVWVWLG
ncbi:MAG: DUF456 domain-containing protein [Anaerolineales bacterium]|jgi:hypothetical protein